MKQAKRGLLNLVAFSLLGVALYLNFIRKDDNKVISTANTVSSVKEPADVHATTTASEKTIEKKAP